MSDQIFRKKSLDRISSPEQLNDSIRVAHPGIWMILAAVIMLYKRNRYPECQKRNSSVYRWERI